MPSLVPGCKLPFLFHRPTWQNQFCHFMKQIFIRSFKQFGTRPLAWGARNCNLLHHRHFTSCIFFKSMSLRESRLYLRTSKPRSTTKSNQVKELLSWLDIGAVFCVHKRTTWRKAYCCCKWGVKKGKKKKGVTVSVRFQASKHMNQHMPAGSAVFCNKGKVINRHHCDLVSSVLNNRLFN